MRQAKADARGHEIERIVDEACSRKAFDEASTHGRQLRPLHVIDGGAAQLARVRAASPSFVMPLWQDTEGMHDAK
jgi:hypothetical protein